MCFIRNCWRLIPKLGWMQLYQKTRSQKHQFHQCLPNLQSLKLQESSMYILGYIFYKLTIFFTIIHFLSSIQRIERSDVFNILWLLLINRHTSLKYDIFFEKLCMDIEATSLERSVKTLSDDINLLIPIILRLRDVGDSPFWHLTLEVYCQIQSSLFGITESVCELTKIVSI